MKKLLYILPEYSREAHTHFSYIPGFLSHLASAFDITLLVERGELPTLGGVRSARANFFAIMRARFSGYRLCYVHYSFKSAFAASLVFRLTGGVVWYWNCGLPWHYRRSVLREAFERLVYRAVSYVVTGTERLADTYASEYGISRSKVLVMPNWIDTKSIQYSVSRLRLTSDGQASIQGEEIRKKLDVLENQKIVLFAHRLSPRKGAQYLPDIAKRLPDDALLVIAGDGPLRQSIEFCVLRFALREKVKFLGWQAHERVLELMAAADAFIMPSDEEGFPHVLLEAMALGVPFVATDVGGVPEIIPSSLKPSLVLPGDMEGFSKRLSEALSLSPETRKERAAEMRAWVSRYDISTVAERFIELVTNP